MNHQVLNKKNQEKLLDNDDLGKLPKNHKFVQNHPINKIIGEPNQGVRSRVSLHQYYNNVAFISNDWANLHGSSLKRWILDQCCARKMKFGN